MRRTVLLVMIALLSLTIPVGAAGWSEKVTGGGEAMAGKTPFSITVSAWKDEMGNTAGQIQYSRPALTFHASVKCLCLYEDENVAVVAGPVRKSSSWAVVEVLEGGVGSGDRVRVRLMAEAAARAACASPSGSFPGVIYDGNFNIRTK